MGVGLFYVQQRRAIDHPQFPVGAKTAGITDVMLSEAKHL
jgi:hypothetical protein